MGGVRGAVQSIATSLLIFFKESLAQASTPAHVKDDLVALRACAWLVSIVCAAIDLGRSGWCWCRRTASCARRRAGVPVEVPACGLDQGGHQRQLDGESVSGHGLEVWGHGFQ